MLRKKQEQETQLLIFAQWNTIFYTISTTVKIENFYNNLV